MSKTLSIPNSNNSGRINKEQEPVTTTYVMRVNRHRYFVTKIDRDERIQYIIGKINLFHCVLINVFPYTDEIILDQIRYSPTCREAETAQTSTSQNVEEKRDTVEMTLGLLQLVMQQNPELCKRLGHIKLKDTSRIEQFKYPLKGGTVIGELILSDYYKLVSDKTWYETHFGAVPDPTDGVLQVTLNKFNRLMQQTKPVSLETFQEFWQIVSETPTEHTLVIESKDVLIDAWSKKRDMGRVLQTIETYV